MMDLCFFSLVALCLIMVQTVVLPGLAFFTHSFDLLIILVLYLSLAFSRYGAVLAIVAVGGVMDSLSGTPFFLHIFSYLWIYIIVQLLKQVVFQRSLLFLVVVSLISVAIQHGLILFSLYLDINDSGTIFLDYPGIIWQLSLGGLLIPPSIWVITLMRQNLRYLVRQLGREMARKYRD